MVGEREVRVDARRMKPSQEFLDLQTWRVAGGDQGGGVRIFSVSSSSSSPSAADWEQGAGEGGWRRGGFIRREMREMNLLDEREERKVRLTSLALRWLWNDIDHQSAWYGGQLGLVDAGWIEKLSHQLLYPVRLLTHFLKSARILSSSSLLSLSLSCLKRAVNSAVRSSLFPPC